MYFDLLFDEGLILIIESFHSNTGNISDKSIAHRNLMRKVPADVTGMIGHDLESDWAAKTCNTLDVARLIHKIIYKEVGW